MIKRYLRRTGQLLEAVYSASTQMLAKNQNKSCFSAFHMYSETIVIPYHE